MPYWLTRTATVLDAGRPLDETALLETGLFRSEALAALVLVVMRQTTVYTIAGWLGIQAAGPPGLYFRRASRSRRIREYRSSSASNSSSESFSTSISSLLAGWWERISSSSLRWRALASRFWVFCMRKTTRNVTIVVPVLMISCQVSEKPK